MTPGARMAGAVERLRDTRPYVAEGSVVRVIGLAVESEGPPCTLGEECMLLSPDGQPLSRGQVVGFSGNRVVSMPVELPRGLAVGCRVLALGRMPRIGVGDHLLGRVLDADGRPLDGREADRPQGFRPLEATPPPAMGRERIRTPFVTGVRAIVPPLQPNAS